MVQGKIKKLVQEKGYGFVSGEKGDVFFHCTAVENVRFEELELGQTVSYEIEMDKRGPRATAVQPM